MVLHRNIGELSTELPLDNILQVGVLLLGQCVLQQRQEKLRKLLGILKMKGLNSIVKVTIPIQCVNSAV